MHQNPMTVITEILPGKEQTLKEYLGPIGLDIKNNPVIRFSAYAHLHYCTFFIVPGNHPSQSGQPAPGTLVFEANVDGSVKQFVDQLISKNPDFMHAVYACCRAYPGEEDPGKLAEYLLAHDYAANAFYVAHPGLSRDTILKQQGIRQQIEEYIDADGNRDRLARQSPKEIRADFLAQLTGISKAPPRPFLSTYGGLIFKCLLLTLSILILGGLVGWLGSVLHGLAISLLLVLAVSAAVLRYHEVREEQDDRLSWEVSDEMRAIQRVEDRQLQNHLTSVTEIKPGWFRLAVLRIVLAAVGLSAKLVATRGNLSGIVTIHFARWVIMPDNKRLLFMSNYDGSWENYLGEFIDHASVGLTAVWSNTQLGTNCGFPDTQWLALRGGSRDEQRFKTYARNSQLAELIWYSAYADLSVKNVGNNRAIHEGMFAAQPPVDWLKRL